MIAMHRIFHRVSWNKHVSIQLRHRHIRHHEAITVVMQNEPSFQFIAGRWL
jgi:hypothetical protein